MADAKPLEEQIMAQLGTVIEPELHRDLVTLDMIRDLKIEESKAAFTIMLTTPACPLKDQIEREATEAVLRVPGVETVDITLDSQVSTDGRIRGRLNLDIANIVAVSSGKGGVGKSTIASNLAIALRQSGAAVGLLDADILGPNQPTLMGLDERPLFSGEKLVPLEAYDVKVMSMGFLVEPGKALIWRGPMLHGAIRQLLTDVAWGTLDYLVVDLPPGTSDAQLSLAQSVPLTGAIIVTQPQQVAADDALRGLAMFEQVNVPIVGVVENMSGEVFGTGGGQALADSAGVPFLGSVPLDPQVRIGGDAGQPIIAVAPDSEAAQALMRIAQEVAARVSVINFEQRDNVIPINTIG
jgi:ATP-binding protein involved in chromosome partitioning